MSSAPITIAAAVPNEEVIAMCEDFLAAAKSGELRSVAVAGVLQGKYIRTAFVNGDASIFETLGAIECLKHRFKVRNIEV